MSTDPKGNGRQASAQALDLVQQTLLGEAIANSGLLVFVADEEMRYVAISNAACEALGYSREELLGLHVTDVAPDPSAPGDYAEMLDTGFHSGTTRVRHKNGALLDFTYVASETRVSRMPYYVAVGTIES